MWIKCLKYISVLALLTVCCTSKVLAQGHYAQGVVYEETKGNPLVGATVIMLNANNRVIGGTATDIDGKFRVLVPEGTTGISFSFVGLKTITQPFDPNKKYEIILKSDETVLSEVVITGKRERQADMGMISKSRKDMSNAVSAVDMKALGTQPVSSVDQLLQGAAPGLQVTFNSGDPGAGASMTIRGVTSLEGNNKPLWVIDGAEVLGEDYNVSDLNNFGSSPIAGLDPADIESIDILKDASSTAIYGSRGANGVIVIRTKRGKSGKPQFSANATWTAVLKPDRIPLLSGDQQRMYVIESRANTNGGDDQTIMPQLRGDLTRTDAWIYNNNTDMVKMLTRTGFQQKYSFSLRGGGDRLSYYWSMGYDTEYGTTKGGGFNRLTTMINLDYRMSDKLKISAKFQYNNQMKDKRSWVWPITAFNRWSNEYINPRAFAHRRAAFLPVYTQDGSEYYIDDEGNNGNDVPSIGTKMYNPIAMVDNATFESRENQFTSLLSLDFDITKKLNFFTMVSVDYREGGNEFFAPLEAMGVFGHHSWFNRGLRDNSYSMLLMNKNRLFYRPVNNDVHYVALNGIFDLIYNTSGSTSMEYNRGGSSQMTESSDAAMWANAKGSNAESTSISVVLDAQYRLLNRYNLNLSLKTEGSSQYGKDNPFSIYPTVGFAWRMEEESFLKEKEGISMLKPRFSWGQTGKLPSITNMLDVTYGSASGGYMNNPYSYISGFAYDNIHEERTTEFNYGLDWDLFNGRFSGEFNYYTRKTKDLLLREMMSSSVGYTDGDGWNRRYTNFGDLKNYGVEIGLTVVPVRLESGFQWSLYVSATRNRQKILKMPDYVKNSKVQGYTESVYNGFMTKLEEGSVIGGFYGYKAKGVYATDDDAVVRDFNGNIVYEANGTPKKMRYSSSTGHVFQGGDMIYEDINHDGVINELDIVQIGDANVGMFGMIRNNINWKQWSLGISFYYSLEQDVINGQRYDLESMKSDNNQATSILRRWRKQGDITDMPRAYDYAEWNYAASSRWVEDASFIKLKEVSLTYNVPLDFTRKLHLKQLSVWVTAMDLWCGTKYKGLNPEIGLNTGTLTKIAVDNSATPPSPQIAFGIRASF